MARLTLDGFQYLLKKYVKNILHENFIEFDISIVDEYFVLHELIYKNEINFYFLVSRIKISLSKKMVNKIENFIYTS